MPLKAPGALDRKPGDQTQRSALVQPEIPAGLPLEGGVPALLGVCLAGVGRTIHGPMVQEGDALTPGIDKEDRAHDPCAQAAHLELVRGPR